MEVLSDSTGEAWAKISLSLLDSGEETIVSNESVIELRWLNIHVTKPLQEPRINGRFSEFIEKISIEDEWKPEAYLMQVTGQLKKGYWWNVYGKPIWDQMPKLESVLNKNPSFWDFIWRR